MPREMKWRVDQALNTVNILVLRKKEYTFSPSDVIFAPADSNGRNIYESIPGFCFIL
jgi:hypothetical protein